MTIYLMTLLVGFEKSGVDVAMAARYRYLTQAGFRVKCVFTDAIINRCVNRYVEMGIRRSDMIGPCTVFTDHISTDEVLEIHSFTQKVKRRLNADRVEENGEQVSLYQERKRLATIIYRKSDGGVEECFYYNKERLIQKDIYLSEVVYSEYYATAKGENGQLYAAPVKRSYKNRNGEVAFDVLLNDKAETFIFPNGEVCTKYGFLEKFIHRIHLQSNDVVVIDRPGWMDFVQPLFRYLNGAKLFVFLHSGHYFEKNEDPNCIAVNSEYAYWFKTSKSIDKFIVSTDFQRDELVQKLQEYGCQVPDVEVIPVAGIDQIHHPNKERKRYSLVTASRLEKRKQVDWIVRAVVKAHEQNPQISLDIYGSGNPSYVEMLRACIQDEKAEEYIHLKGHQKLDQVYENYEAYISASLWETFGLSVMEAAASGNALIGLDAKYGNKVFIQDGINGYRVPFEPGRLDTDIYKEQLIDTLANAIVTLFQDEDRLHRFQEASYTLAERYHENIIAKQWAELMIRAM